MLKPTASFLGCILLIAFCAEGHGPQTQTANQITVRGILTEGGKAGDLWQLMPDLDQPLHLDSQEIKVFRFRQDRRKGPASPIFDHEHVELTGELVSVFHGVAVLEVRSIQALDMAQDGDGIFQSGDWKYQLMVLGQSTSQPKSIGKLSFQGKEVIGSPYHRIITDLGQFMWSSYSCEQFRCGWHKIDPTKKHSRWVIAKIDDSEQGPVWHTVEAKSP